MFKINKKIEYALMALKHMSGKDAEELTSVKELCDEYKMPFDVMSKVMQKLVSGDLLQSEKGAHGGYSIKKDLNAVNVLELHVMVMGENTIAKCMSQGSTKCAMQSTCNVKSPMYDLDERLRQFYQTISLQDLLNPGQ